MRGMREARRAEQRKQRGERMGDAGVTRENSTSLLSRGNGIKQNYSEVTVLDGAAGRKRAAA